MNSRGAHQAGTRLLSSLMMVIGVVLIIQAVIGATGGGLITRLILGVLFLAAGAGRLYVLARASRSSGSSSPPAAGNSAPAGRGRSGPSARAKPGRRREPR